MPETLIITGMHRSGTSFMASIIQTMGIDIGDRLVEANHFNPKGYFEDVDFLEFQRAALQACCSPNQPGHSDWGWTKSERFDRTKLKDYIEAAKELINRRNQKAAIWSWKDPRTSLMLDFWDNLIPNAKYLFVYRFPWDVWYSIVRTNNPVLDVQVDDPVRIWCFYNRHILDFYQRNSERCLLVNTNAFVETPSQLAELIKNKLSLEIKYTINNDKISEFYQSTLFKILDWHHPLAESVRRHSPQSIACLRELDELADMPSNFSVRERKYQYFLGARKISNIFCKNPNWLIFPSNFNKVSVPFSRNGESYNLREKLNIEVVKVSKYKCRASSLLAHYIDIPQKGTKLHASYITMAGWVLGKSAPAVKVELKSNKYVLWEVPVNRSRPDVAAVYPDALEAEKSGFLAEVEIVGMPAKIEIMLEAVFPDGTHVPLGAIALRRIDENTSSKG